MVTARPSSRRLSALAAAALGIAVVAFAPTPTLAATVGSTSTPGSTASTSHPTNPYSPQANGHQYRHGAFPDRATNGRMKAWAATNAATGPQTLSYGGGVDGIGVTSGTPKVYLVFWGSQWGSSSTDANGNLAFSNDSVGGAGRLQQMFKGLGTNNELWSGVMTQYCDGSLVSSGATSCPSGAAHVGYPASGATLAGVWYDSSSAEPAAATGAQLGTEAVNAAAHFGNTTAAQNRYVQYVILSPTGLNPDNYKTGGFCAWHDWNGDVAVTSPYGDIAFTNMPYVMDQGTSCGQNFVNSGTAGLTDGYTMVEGHEYAETITDQNPAGGWTNHTGSASNGQENADECAWISPGSAGGAGNIAMASGTFAEQATWSNDTNRCDLTHAIVGGGSTGNTVTVTNPGNRSGTVGTATSLQINATDSASGQTLTYSATGLPAGLSINSSTGLISGTPTTAGTYSVTAKATDTTGASGSATFTWTIASAGGCSGQLLANPGFESGAVSWSSSTGVIGQNGPSEPARTGTWDAWLDGYGSTHTDTVSQSITIPAGCAATLSYYVHIDTAETTTTTAYDTLTVKVGSTVLQTLSNLNAASGYQLKTVSLSAYAGQTVTVTFTGSEDSSLQTSFVLDDTAVNLS